MLTYMHCSLLKIYNQSTPCRVHAHFAWFNRLWARRGLCVNEATTYLWRLPRAHNTLPCCIRSEGGELPSHSTSLHATMRLSIESTLFSLVSLVEARLSTPRARNSSSKNRRCKIATWLLCTECGTKQGCRRLNHTRVQARSYESYRWLKHTLHELRGSKELKDCDYTRCLRTQSTLTLMPFKAHESPARQATYVKALFSISPTSTRVRRS